MQVVIRQRETLTLPQTTHTEPLDISGIPALTVGCTVHQISGTSPNMTIDFETSDNLEDWTDVGNQMSVSAVGLTTENIRVGSNQNLLRYLRARIQPSGTNVVVNFSLSINTFLGT